MKIPVIGITTTKGKNDSGYRAVLVLQAYVSAIISERVAPVLIPSDLSEESVKSLFQRLDGILFTGGGDINTKHYGVEFHPLLAGSDPERDGTEMALVRLASSEGKPFLGICRGCQVINVALGGTLFTDIHEQKQGAIKHDYYPNWPRNYLAHEISVEKDSEFARVLGGERTKVNSLHHQGLNNLASGLVPFAYAPDGLVEAFVLRDHPHGFAVQWHPEWLTERNEMKWLFSFFIEAVRQQV